MRLRNIGWGCVLLLGVGCASSLKVYDRQKEAQEKVQSRPGIPFYTKSQQYRHTTTYQESWYEVTLAIWSYPKGTQRPNIEPERKSVRADAKGAIDALAQLVWGAQRESKEHPDKVQGRLDEIRAEFSKLTSYSPGTTDKRAWELVGNTLEREIFIDYGREFYLNARMPWFGNVDAITELSPDGTLTKSEVKEESHPEKIADLIPLKEVLTAALVKKPETAVAGEKEMPRKTSLDVEIEFSVEQKVYLYDLSEIVPVVTRQAAIPIPRDRHDCEIRRRAIEAQSPTPEKEKEAADQPTACTCIKLVPGEEKKADTKK